MLCHLNDFDLFQNFTADCQWQLRQLPDSSVCLDPPFRWCVDDTHLWMQREVNQEEEQADWEHCTVLLIQLPTYPTGTNSACRVDRQGSFMWSEIE